jgi:hypothetical protein
MNTTDIMKDPFFTPILFQIERQILGCARVAQANGILLNDSQIRSTLNKVRKSSEGAKPQIPNESPRDQALASLHHDLLQVRSALRVEDADGRQEPLPNREWLLCLRTVEESIQLRSSGPGSRAYLAFLEDFIPKGTL